MGAGVTGDILVGYAWVGAVVEINPRGIIVLYGVGGGEYRSSIPGIDSMVVVLDGAVLYTREGTVCINSISS